MRRADRDRASGVVQREQLDARLPDYRPTSTCAPFVPTNEGGTTLAWWTFHYLQRYGLVSLNMAN